jgi:glucan endo-1,3-alpha-glucosidase
VPAFFVKPEDLNKYPVLDGLFGWDGSWPKEDRRPSWDYDHSRTSALGQDKIYIGAASPWFFTHYPSKNWFYGGDEWLYNTRWEQLVAHRNEVDIVEVISWNGM